MPKEQFDEDFSGIAGGADDADFEGRGSFHVEGVLG
jgi:hypothetical protein